MPDLTQNTLTPQEAQKTARNAYVAGEDRVFLGDFGWMMSDQSPNDLDNVQKSLIMSNKE